jgi:hypothetical protein
LYAREVPILLFGEPKNVEFGERKVHSAVLDLALRRLDIPYITRLSKYDWYQVPMLEGSEYSVAGMGYVLCDIRKNRIQINETSGEYSIGPCYEHLAECTIPTGWTITLE